MSPYRIDWSRLVDRELVSEIAGAAGLAPAPAVVDLRAVLARILAGVGGWPYAATRPSAARARAHVHRLLDEALARGDRRRPPPPPGYRLHAPRRGMRAVEAVARTEVNLAPAEELAGLPGISRRLAELIVVERERHGPFGGPADLAGRVAGLGLRRATRLAGMTAFGVAPAPLVAASADWRQRLADLVTSERGPDVRARLLAALGRVAASVTAEPHPHGRRHLPRDLGILPPPRSQAAGRAIVLSGQRYHRYVRRAIGRARDRVDVMMFHTAMPDEDHPTRRLLDGLARARRRGVRVRVLVDRDRRGDPYRSRVINAAAVQYLLGRRVAVRVDRPGRLLHSKMVVIDRDTTIIGSHNWTAGSYFAFDDLSVAVSSTGLAASARRRFERLWRRGEPARRGAGTAVRR